MNEVLVAVFAILVFLVILFFYGALAAIGGAFAGWIASIFFPATAAKLVVLTGFKAYQLGAIVGFVGAFFRSVPSFSNKE